MPKDIPVGNGNLLINFDGNYQIRDVYYPLIGQENHSNGGPFKFGVWVDGNISWMGSNWKKDLRYQDDALVTSVYLKNEDLNLELQCEDTVDIDLNVFVRKIKVNNLIKAERQLRLFFVHDFHLYGNDIGDTAYFDPRSHTIIHYKANRYFLINCCDTQWCGVKHYSCSEKEEPEDLRREQVIKDGELDGKAISWGSANSTIGIYLHLPALGEAVAHYWIAAGEHYGEVRRINELVIENTPDGLIERTSNYWKAWARKEPRSFGDLPNSISDIFKRSLLILKTQIDNRGPIIAGNDSDIIRFGKDTYSYMWGRDGAFVAAALAKAGYTHSCEKFFEFCAGILTDDGYLFQHYNPDGSLASNWHPWLLDGQEVLPIQEDSTALLIWSLWLYYENTKNIEFIRFLYDGLIKKSANFLVTFRDKETGLPCPGYDLWEERYGVHTFTVSAVIAGLKAAVNFAKLLHDFLLEAEYLQVAGRMSQRLIKHPYHDDLKRYARSGYRNESGYDLDEVIDVSLLGLIIFEVLSPDDPRMVQTAAAISEELWLKTDIEGCARYKNDYYQRSSDIPTEIVGNPWFISTLWLGEYYIFRAKNLDELHKAVPYLLWVAKNALPSGVLAEQVHPINGEPLSVSPLTWSHSAFVWTVLLYAEKYELLKN